MSKIEKKIKDYLNLDLSELNTNKKEKKIIEILKLQIKHHRKNCQIYNNWYSKNNFLQPEMIKKYEDVPFLPSAVFKKFLLKSTTQKNKIITSSGSSGQSKSSIYIDSSTSNLQKISLSKLLMNVLGNKRRTFFIVDIEPTENFQHNIISARYAGMTGYLMAASSKIYLLKFDKNNKLILNKKSIQKLFELIEKEPIVIIGYTYMLWEYLLNSQQLNFQKLDCDKNFKIIHFGGWKKLENKSVSKENFNTKILKLFKINPSAILDIYGFSEQLGNIFISRGLGGCNVNSFSHVLIRNPKTLRIANDGEEGFLQFLSILPLSYPGFSILNDDIGYISKRKKNKNVETLEFKIKSRLAKLEPRGCGDTLPKNYYI